MYTSSTKFPGPGLASRAWPKGPGPGQVAGAVAWELRGRSKKGAGPGSALGPWRCPWALGPLDGSRGALGPCSGPMGPAPWTRALLQGVLNMDAMWAVFILFIRCGSYLCIAQTGPEASAKRAHMAAVLVRLRSKPYTHRHEGNNTASKV